MPEIIVNLHIHTRYSDGSGTHAEIAQAAIRAGIDAVIVTDHNVLVQGKEGYHYARGETEEGGKRLLMLVGEEIHDQARLPQKSHLLVFGVNQELAPLASNLPGLIKAIRRDGGLAFIAHPLDPPAPAFHEDDLSWDDWGVQGLHGMEIWNSLSEFKSLLKTKAHALYYAFNPEMIQRGPFPQVLQRWDELLAGGQRFVAVGGSDAHAQMARMGPLRRVIFPYEFHFRLVNTHLLLTDGLQGDLETDRRAVLEALQRGRSFIANDLPAPARGFSFIANGYGRKAGIGDEISASKGVTFQIRLPSPADCRLLRDGRVIQTWQNQMMCVHNCIEPGAYRVEAYRAFKGRMVGWIFSNPIYVVK